MSKRAIDPAGAPGRPAPFVAATLASLRFAGLTLLVGLVSLALLFAPGIGVIAWFAANGYLLGREYFEFAAMRFYPAARGARLAPAARRPRLPLWAADRRLRRRAAGQPADAAVRHDADGAGA